MLGSTKEQRSKEATEDTSGLEAPDCPVHHWTVSSAPKDFNANSSPSGILQSRHAIIHRTVRCTPDSVRCSNGTRLRNSPASGNQSGCSAIIHRTCPVCTGLSGASTEQRLLRRQRLPAMHLMRAQKSESPMPAHRTVNSACPVRHRTSRRAHKSELQRSDSNGTGDVAGAPDMSGVHRTVRCAIEQTTSTNGHVWWLGL